MRTFIVSLGVVCAWVVVASSSAHAAEPAVASKSEATEAPLYALRFFGGPRMATSYGSKFGGGVGLEGTIEGRASIFEVGVRADFLTTLVAGNRAGAAGFAGLGWHGRSLSLSFQGEVGVHAYSDVGRNGLLSSDPGGSGAVPFAGARVGLSVRLPRRGHITTVLGIAASLQRDAVRSVNYSYRNEGLFNTTTDSATERIGGTELAFVPYAGIELD